MYALHCTALSDAKQVKVTAINLWVDESLAGKTQHYFTVCLPLYDEWVIHGVIEKVQKMFWMTSSCNVPKICW